MHVFVVATLKRSVVTTFLFSFPECVVLSVSFVFIALVSCAFMSVSLSPLPRRVGHLLRAPLHRDGVLCDLCGAAVVAESTLAECHLRLHHGCVDAPHAPHKCAGHSLAHQRATQSQYWQQMDEVSRARSKTRISSCGTRRMS